MYEENYDEHTENNNDKSSEQFEMEVLAEVTIEKEVMIHDSLKLTKYLFKTTYEIINAY